MYSGIIRRGHNLLFHMKKANHSIEVKVFRWPVVSQLSSAEDETLVGQPLRAVHVERFANFHKSVL